MRPITKLLYALVLCAATASSAAAQARLERGYALGATGSLKVFNFLGSVRVVGWDRDSVSVTGTLGPGARYFGGGGPDGVKLGVESGADTKSTRADLVIHVPATAVVWVRGAATDITIEGVIGSVDVGTVGGRVRVEGAPRELIAESMDGAMVIIGSPGVLRAKTASGALSWQGAGTEAMLSSVSGRVSAEGGPLGRARIETVSGDVRVLAALRADAMLMIESHSGSVELRLPTKVPTRVTADVAEITGAGIKPVAGGQAVRRAPARKLDFGTSPGADAAEITVRSFKGSLRIVP